MKALPKYTKPGADVRREQILSAAMTLAEAEGFQNVRRDAVAIKAKVSQGLVNLYFGNMDALRTALMARAVQSGNVRVIAQGLIGKHPEALKASQAVRSLAAGQVFDA